MFLYFSHIAETFSRPKDVHGSTPHTKATGFTTICAPCNHDVVSLTRVPYYRNNWFDTLLRNTAWRMAMSCLENDYSPLSGLFGSQQRVSWVQELSLMTLQHGRDFTQTKWGVGRWMVTALKIRLFCQVKPIFIRYHEKNDSRYQHRVTVIAIC